MKFSNTINEDGYMYVPYAEVKTQETEIKRELDVCKKALYMACNGNEYIMELYLNEAKKREDKDGR